MSPTITDSKELAAKAADEIERRGWRSGALTEVAGDWENCKVCVLGATGAVYYGNPERGYDTDGNYETLLDEIGLNVADYVSDDDTAIDRLWYWNDTFATRQEKPQQYVVGELRRYAESA